MTENQEQPAAVRQVETDPELGQVPEPAKALPAMEYTVGEPEAGVAVFAEPEMARETVAGFG